MQHQITHESHTIAFDLIQSTRRKTMSIIVHEDQRVQVRAPRAAPLDTVTAFVKSKAHWVKKQQANFAKTTPSPHYHYTHGEVHHYLGHPVLLRIRQGLKEKVQLQENTLIITQTPRSKTETLLYAWYHEQAHALFTERLQMAMRRVKCIGIVTPPPIRIKRMKTCWGSCSSRGNVSLNVELIHHPIECIDYIICHELCHLIEMNHSPAYYALLDQVMPDWRTWKARLAK